MAHQTAFHCRRLMKPMPRLPYEERSLAHARMEWALGSSTEPLLEQFTLHPYEYLHKSCASFTHPLQLIKHLHKVVLNVSWCPFITINNQEAIGNTMHLKPNNISRVFIKLYCFSGKHDGSRTHLDGFADHYLAVRSRAYWSRRRDLNPHKTGYEPAELPVLYSAMYQSILSIRQ